ncbi:Uncharacterised protein [Serratia marcescens]|uniref:ead/Ea22-like family protein n=1 Tax=Serratia marcescens TaxID=615 RepID=UPI00074523CA|nr:ead/Ea22-like family protein [Serratia marcescens]CVE51251.1 Uncharacterised protein [Serratia marcescens]
MDKFSELKAAAMAATPGPWILDDDSWSEGDNANVSTEERYDGRIVSIAQIEGGGSESGFDEPFSAEQQANARYITAANPAVVLALLAERDSNQQNYQNAMEELRIERSQRQAADQRIAELEVLLDRNIKRAKKLGELLATPVRLPGALIPAVHASGEPFMRPEPFGFYLNRDDVIKKLRAAGFTVEGDD